MLIRSSRLSIEIRNETGEISSLKIDGAERLACGSPLFRVGIRYANGELLKLSSHDSAAITENEINGKKNRITFSNFSACPLTVTVDITTLESDVMWGVSASPNSNDYVVEWIDFPLVSLPKLKDENENGGRILYPYNEGALVTSMRMREESFLHYCEPEYPSKGLYSMFPNMICSQFISYLWDDASLYIGAHDPCRAPKAIDFFDNGNGITMQLRLYTGCEMGADFVTDYPVIWSVCGSSWESSAEKYRTWLECNLPPRVKKTKDNNTLPDWYSDSPLVVAYPVRGNHDTDVMTPNALFPYVNALPLIDEIKHATNARILTLLMHWEGTAPWAPPEVWPPFGGEDALFAFRDALHSRGDLLGVYCSGFGYTLKSNLIDGYENTEKYKELGLSEAMCQGPKGEIRSVICTEQRVGLDVCPASERGQKLLLDAYSPLFDSGLDYAQILDQNHGGGQYLCYSRDHGHPPVPGKWMTENMQAMLTEWNNHAKNMLFGCESAAAEPFIGNIAYSDNRFELIYNFATPVPLYAYIYHEYVRNFMGNQVCCPFPTEPETLCYRLAYSFSIGDSMTLVMTPDGKIMSHWGTRDFVNTPDKKKVYTLIKNLTEFYRNEAKDYLLCGKMTAQPVIECENRFFTVRDDKIKMPALLSSSWESSNGKAVTIIVNPEEKEKVCKIDGNPVFVPPLSAILL